MCLANDAVLDSLIGLCESLRTHSPALPMTVIPYNSAIERTRALARAYGYDVYEDASLSTMDSFGARYWPGEKTLPHNMRKFCAFWGPYERFLFLDADIVVIHPLEPYFDAFRRSDADFVYFATDIANVYRPGPVRAAMMHHYATAGFNGGTYMGRRGALTAARLEQLRASAEEHRHGFVDNLEQSFLNYAVDVGGLVKADAHELVPSLVEAGALMRLKRRNGKLILADARVPESGREVTMIHWAGYHVRPFMPYRRIFLRYRLARRSPRERWGYHVRAFTDAVARVTYKTPVRLVRRWRWLARNILASRGLVGWP